MDFGKGSLACCQRCHSGESSRYQVRADAGGARRSPGARASGRAKSWFDETMAVSPTDEHDQGWITENGDAPVVATTNCRGRYPGMIRSSSGLRGDFLTGPAGPVAYRRDDLFPPRRRTASDTAEIRLSARSALEPHGGTDRLFVPYLTTVPLVLSRGCRPFSFRSDTAQPRER
jgi:hypothetical protein